MCKITVWFIDDHRCADVHTKPMLFPFFSCGNPTVCLAKFTDMQSNTPFNSSDFEVLIHSYNNSMCIYIYMLKYPFDPFLKHKVVPLNSVRWQLTQTNLLSWQTGTPPFPCLYDLNPQSYCILRIIPIKPHVTKWAPHPLGCWWKSALFG